MVTRVGFIGLGNIGLPMAVNLCVPGFAVTVFDLNPAASAQPAACGAAVAASVGELARASALIGICVRDDADVRSVMLGPDGLIARAGAGTAVAIHSTVRPETVREMAQAAGARGIEVVDAPITGGADGARAKRLAYMVGGEPATIERLRPMFEASGQKIVIAGALGSGMTLKLCNNLITYLEFVAADESVRLASASGLPIERLFELTAENGVMTAQMRALLENRMHGPAKYGAEVMRRAFESFAGIAEKDLDCALGAAADCGIELPGARAARSLIRGVYLS